MPNISKDMDTYSYTLPLGKLQKTKRWMCLLCYKLHVLNYQKYRVKASDMLELDDDGGAQHKMEKFFKLIVNLIYSLYLPLLSYNFVVVNAVAHTRIVECMNVKTNGALRALR